jgi:hypothetical protein
MLKIIYDEIDSNKDSSVEYDELKDFFSRMNFIIPDQVIEKLMRDADTDTDGFLNFTEFKSIMIEAEKLHASPVWLLLKERHLSNIQGDSDMSVSSNSSSMVSSSIVSGSSYHSSSKQSSSSRSVVASLRRRPHQVNIPDTISDVSGSVESSSSHSLYRPTEASLYHSVDDISQHSFPTREFCDNCGAQDHTVHFCDKACTFCVHPPCGKMPTKCSTRCKHIPVPPLKKQSILETLQLDTGKTLLPLAIPTSITHKVIQKQGTSSTLIHASAPLGLNRPASITDITELVGGEPDAKSTDPSSVFQGDIVRYLQVGVTQLPLDAKSTKLRYNMRWSLITSLAMELKNRKCKISSFMAKLRLNALGRGKRALLQQQEAERTGDHSVTANDDKKTLDVIIHDPLAKFGIWVPRHAFIDTFTEVNSSMDVRTRQTLFSALDARKRGGVPTFELTALLVAADIMFCGKTLFEVLFVLIFSRRKYFPSLIIFITLKDYCDQYIKALRCYAIFCP